MGYKLVTYDAGKGPRAGIVAGDRLIDAAEATGNAAYATTLGILNDWAAADKTLRRCGQTPREERTDRWKQIPSAAAAARAIYCAGANYGDHVREMNAAQGRGPEPDPHTLGLKPWHFIKSAHAIVGTGRRRKDPAASNKMDWEVELAARHRQEIERRHAEADALGYVAGYTVSNDRLGARSRLASADPADVAVLLRLARAQELRRLVPARVRGSFPRATSAIRKSSAFACR